MVIKANTTIALKDETKALLDSMKITPSETYDSVINRLIQFISQPEEEQEEEQQDESM